MRKLILLFVSALIIASYSMLSFTNVSARTINTDTENGNQTAQLTQSGLHGKELAQNVVIKQNGKVINDNANVKTTQYTRRLKTETDLKGTTTTTYSTVTIFAVDPGGGGGGGTTLPDYDAAQYRTEWDGSIGVKAVSTLYWTETYDYTMNLSYIELVMVDGEWTIYDYQLSISSKEVEIKSAGNYYLFNGYGYSLYNYNDTIYYYPSSGSFQYYSPTHFDFHSVTTALSYGIGVNMKCTVNRGGSSWSLELFNSYSFNIWM